MIGFGSVEADYRKKVEADVARLAECLYETRVRDNPDADYFDGAYEKALSRILKRLANRSRVAARKLDVQEPTNSGRYSSYYASVLCNASELVVVLRFIHINRRHAFSPDGWALMQIKTLVHLEHWDFDQKLRKARPVPAIA